MAKIAEIITLYPGMSNTVNLATEFVDPEKNRRRMEGYKPIKSHREIFLKISKSFLPNQDKVHLFVGQYGTGKSHLLLMLANYFSNTLEMPELKIFFKNFTKADKDLSRQIQNLRGEGRYLVVIPDYESLEDFSENLISSIEAALKREEFDEEIDSIYKEAVRTLEKWEEDETAGNDALRKYSAFVESLNKQSGNYNAVITLKEGLLRYERVALLTFQDIYKGLLATNFRYSANNIVDILKEINESKSFKKRFKGIVFLYDEFDHTLKSRKISIQVVQQFAEYCKNSNNIIFIGSLHKELSSFANEFSVEDFRTVQQRFKTVDMKKDGLEEIASAIVHVNQENPLFIELVKPNLPNVYNKIIQLQQLSLLSWLTPDEIKEKIIDAVYPLHPLTMACLLELSTTVGSSNRTLFTFLGGEGIDEDNEYSYKAFINKYEILDDLDLLNYYTADHLVDYFQKELDINNVNLRETIKRSVAAYQSSLKEFNSHLGKDKSLFDPDEKIYLRILKLMLVFDIVGIPARLLNILYGLNLQLRQERMLKSEIKGLVEQKIIFFNKQAQVYEFRRGSDIDWDSVIQTEKERIISTGSYDLPSQFLDIYKEPTFGKYLDAKKYNSAKDADKTLLRVFELAKDFGKTKKTNNGNDVDYFTYYENELKTVSAWKDSYDGVIIYVIAETDEEIISAKNIVKNNKSQYVVTAIPENPIPIQDAFIELLAALRVKNSAEYKDAPVGDLARLDENYIGDINRGYAKKYLDLRNLYLSSRSSTWYGTDAKIIESRPQNEQEPGFKFLSNLYNSFNNINDEDINRCHKPLSSAKKLILRDAINHLLEAGNRITIDTSYGNDKGFIRYLKNVFINKQLLSKVSGSSGSIWLTEVEKDFSKYRMVFPALADMIADIHSNESINVKQFINKYRYAPYGLSEVSLILFLAFVIKYFGDELAYKKIPNQPGEVQIQSFDQLEEIVNSSSPFAVFEKRKLDEAQKQLVVDLFKIFGDKDIAVGEIPRTKELLDKIISWYDKLPRISKAEELYKDESVQNFLSLIKADASDPYTFLFEKLQTVFGFDAEEKLDAKINETVVGGVKSILKSIESKLDEIEEKILTGYLAIFGVKGTTFGNLEDSIIEWYNDLDANQRELNAEWHSKNSRPLVKFLKDTQNLRSLIFDSIPTSNDYSLGKVAEWNVDNTQIYLDKVKDGLETIRNAKILVEKPVVVVENGKVDYESGKDLQITCDKIKDLIIRVSLPQNAKEIWVNYQGNDPRSKNSQKEILKENTVLQIDKNSRTIILVAVDVEQNFSQTITLKVRENFRGKVDETVFGYEVKKIKNIKDFELTIKDLARRVLDDKIVSNEELVKLFDELTREFSDDN